MRFSFILVLASSALLAVGCGGKVVAEADGAGGSPGSSGSSGTTTTTTSPADCGGLDFCACSALAECGIVYGGCICGCDYQCPGEPPCDCDCGGGPYHGCAPASCPGPFAFDEGAVVAFDAQGCPYAP